MKGAIPAVMLALLIAVVPAVAKDILNVEGESGFAAQQQRIFVDLNEGNRYTEIAPRDLEKVKSALARIDQALSTRVNVQAVDERTKVAIFNDQELVNTILTQAAEDSRMVCERTRRIGSQRLESTCKTVGERRRDRQASQDYHRHHPQFRPPVEP